jgi:hypothetical protein
MLVRAGPRFIGTRTRRGMKMTESTNTDPVSPTTDPASPSNPYMDGPNGPADGVKPVTDPYMDTPNEPQADPNGDQA